MKSKVLAILKQILIFSAVVVAIGQWQSRHLPSGAAPSFPVHTLNGEAFELPSRNELSVIYFFATWCGVCRVSMPNLHQIQEYFPQVSVRAVALDYETAEEVVAFKSDLDLQVPVYLGDEQVRKLWKINAYPTYVVVDAKGRIQAASIGYSSQLGMILRVVWAKIVS